jgi:hypothetical protein
MHAGFAVQMLQGLALHPHQGSGRFADIHGINDQQPLERGDMWEQI